MFWWQAPDGSKVLAFEEPATGGWYNGDVTMKNFDRLLDFAGKTGSRDMLWVSNLQANAIATEADNIRLRALQRVNRVRLHLALGGSFGAAPATVAGSHADVFRAA